MLRLAHHGLRPSGLVDRIEILGLFGSGKTTLATKIASQGYELLPERHEQNSLWTNPAASTVIGQIAYDLWFLLHHAELVASYSISDSKKVAVCDWSFDSDRAWAEMRLEGDDVQAYRSVHNALMARLGRPLGYLYLKQPTDLVIERLQLRGRRGEAGFLAHIRRAAETLDRMVTLLPGDLVMTVSDDTGVLQIDERIGWWQKGVTNDS